MSAQNGAPLRRVNVPFFNNDLHGADWTHSALFWFGEARFTQDGVPGSNYADVRVAYTPRELAIYVNVVDYYTWYDGNATASTDLTQMDAVGIHIDTGGDRAAAPQSDDYFFLSALCVNDCKPGHRQQARGTGSGWDSSWTGAWRGDTYASWWCGDGCGPCGPNRNTDCGHDFGWWAYVSIPWSTLGRSGPPAEGERWGLGVMLYDRDNPTASGMAPARFWPETFSHANPSTWGEMVFNPSAYTPPQGPAAGTTVIRRGLPGARVEDASVGGRGSCGGGHMGDPDADNNGADTSLFVANQSLIADFPCFNKSFLRFGLDTVPKGKTILSAKLKLHLWSTANPGRSQFSIVQAFTVDNTWEKGAVTWNNAPLARENIASIRVDPIDQWPGWPGIPYEWDVTRAVAEAYASGQPLSIALYSADTEFDSGKFFTSSETEDWNAAGRPTLAVVWGDEGQAGLVKRASPSMVDSGGRVEYTLTVTGNGSELDLTDPLPPGVSAPSNLSADMGTVRYDEAQRRVGWTGRPDAGQTVQIRYTVTVEERGPVTLSSTAELTGGGPDTLKATATVVVDGFRIHLPGVWRSR
ncbi:MAG TPA: DNRLRE domain-containing protein [Chloroflexi bacterium]|nr:DNRLRE domain-containing protein [Chloroflexota bacterium]